MTGLFTANLAATLFMTGLIWFVQVVHYPLFSRVCSVKVDSAAFRDYERAHTRLTTLVVGPPMLVEAATAAALAFFDPGWWSWTGLALVLAIWISTAAIQVPCHTRLETGFDAAVHRRLVRSNWIRTIAWTLRSSLALFAVFQK